MQRREAAEHPPAERPLVEPRRNGVGNLVGRPLAGGAGCAQHVPRVHLGHELAEPDEIVSRPALPAVVVGHEDRRRGMQRRDVGPEDCGRVAPAPFEDAAQPLDGPELERRTSPRWRGAEAECAPTHVIDSSLRRRRAVEHRGVVALETQRARARAGAIDEVDAPDPPALDRWIDEVAGVAFGHDTDRHPVGRRSEARESVDDVGLPVERPDAEVEANVGVRRPRGDADQRRRRPPPGILRGLVEDRGEASEGVAQRMRDVDELQAPASGADGTAVLGHRDPRDMTPV